MKFTITLQATVYAYAEIDIDNDGADLEGIRAEDIKDSRDVKFYLGTEAADDARMQIERAKEQLRRKLRLLNDTPSEVFCEYEIDDEPTFDLQRFAGRQWKPTTAAKRAVKRYLRTRGIDEHTNELAAEMMVVFYNSVMVMRSLPAPSVYSKSYKVAEEIADNLCRGVIYDVKSISNPEWLINLRNEPHEIVIEAFEIFRASFGI